MQSKVAQSVYWPGITKAIEDKVGKCSVCQKHLSANVKEPMIPHEIPEIPWTKLGSDILEFNGTYYLVVVDYTSKCPEVCCLGKSKTVTAVISKLKTIFGRFGIPSELIADMPYAIREMRVC